VSEYELVESIGIYISNSIQSISIYLTVVSAYLVAAFIAGERLTRRQVVIVNCLFVAGAGIFTYTTIGLLFRQQHYVLELAQLQPKIVLPGRVPLAPIMGFVQLGGIGASLKFMWDVRHPKE
jgi:hypothetical protein